MAMNGIGLVVCAVCGWPVTGSIIVSQLPWSAVMNTVAFAAAAAVTMRPMQASMVSSALTAGFSLPVCPTMSGLA